MNKIYTPFSKQVGIEYPIICGPMYPCSNAELVAAVSKSGGIGIIQPISMTYVFKQDFREGIRWIKTQTDNPIGVNVLIEKSSKVYEEKMKKWVDIALEEGIKFYITSLGNPKWVVDKVRPAGGIVYHDVTEKKWAIKALEADVDGLICVNNRAGGHAGKKSPEEIYNELKDFGKPLICAGGIGNKEQFIKALEIGYAGVQMGTRFIATKECTVHEDYKNAILKAGEKDIVLTDKLSGTECSIIRTPYIEKIGVKSNWLAKKLLKNPKTKYMMRTLYALTSIRKLKKASLEGISYKDFFQAGKSVSGIDRVETVADIIKDFSKVFNESEM